MPAKSMRVRKVSFTLDDRSLRVYHQTAARLGLTVSSLLRLVATKLESGEFRV